VFVRAQHVKGRKDKKIIGYFTLDAQNFQKFISACMEL